MQHTNQFSATRWDRSAPQQAAALSCPASTDRARTGATSTRRPCVGVDTIRLRGQVSAGSLAVLPLQRKRLDLDHSSGTISERPTSSEVSLDEQLVLRVDTWRGRPEAVLEVSVPRLLRGDNSLPATVSEVHDAVRELHAQAAEFVRWKDAPDELEVIRLDVVRDFTGVSGGQRLLSELARLPPHRAGTAVHLTRACDGVQTLYRKTDRWQSRTYDRAEHYANRASRVSGEEADRLRELARREQGKLRYELQLGSRAARDHGLTVVAQLRTTDLAGVSKHYFDRSRLGERVGGGESGLGDALAWLRTHDLYKSFPAVAGQLVTEHLGIEQASSAKTQHKYRMIARRAGLTWQDLLGGLRVGGVTPPRRLDFDAGTLLVGDDALGRAA